MQNSSPFPFYAPSSPPWYSFTDASSIPHPDPPPAGLPAVESNPASNVDSGRILCSPSFTPNPAWTFPSLPKVTVQDTHSQPDASQDIAQPLAPPCGSQMWQMERQQRCMDMEDSTSLDQGILESNVVVYGEGTQEPQPTADVQDSLKGIVNTVGTSVRENNSSSICKLGSAPYIGLQFGSEGEAYEYYNAYAKEKGFNIRRNRVQRSRVDRSVISREYVCAKQGFRSLKDKRYKGKVVQHRQETRVDCRAAMCTKRRSDKWVVYQFHEEHNHDLSDPMKVGKHQLYQKMTNRRKSMLEDPYKIQCLDMEGNVSFGQEILEADVVVFDESTQEHQPVDVQESEIRVVNTAETSGRGDDNAQESSNVDFNTAETTGREGNNASLVKLGCEPHVGLRFGSEDEAYEYYNAYAKEKGFSIRRNRIQRSRIDHSVISREYVCANEGFRKTTDKRYIGKVIQPRQETRVDCRAAMSIKKRSGKWVVDQFHKEHNHDLVDPAKAFLLRSHRKMTNTTISMIEALSKCGVEASEIMDLLTEVTDGAKDINEQDHENVVKKERKNNIRVECYNLLEYFQGIQAADPRFFYAVEFDENRCMRSIFWADGKAREAYQQFGDVLVFDTVCRANKFLFPFTTFTGLNHHRQSLLFGCGFLADETVESFVWLFETWLRAMSNRQPISIITNREKAMKVAIEKVFPEVRHQFGLWDKEKDELENLSHVFNRHKDFQAEYKSCIYSSRTPEEFESGWEALILKYNLKDNKWLNKLYNQRCHWVPVYLRDAFFAGLTKTWSKGVNSFFDGFLHEGTPFTEFIAQYEQAVKQRLEEEAAEDFSTLFTRAVLTSKNPIEEQAARFYTRNMFTIFGNEFLESSGCIARKIGEEGPIDKYSVGKYSDTDDNMDMVLYNSIDKSASCSCRMFEFEGMLCRHVLKVFQMVNVFEIPHQYILKRWTMSARYIGSCNNEAGSSVQDVIDVWTLKDTTKRFVEFGAISSYRTNVALKILQNGMKELSLVSVSTISGPPENIGCSSIRGENVNEQTIGIKVMDLNITAHDSLRTKTNIRPVSRMKLGIEQAQKKKRTCGTCKETGHYTRTCPKGAVDECQTSTMRQGPIGQSQNSTLLEGHFDSREMKMRTGRGPYHPFVVSGKEWIPLWIHWKSVLFVFVGWGFLQGVLYFSFLWQKVQL